jgi:hypothetical protein
VSGNATGAVRLRSNVTIDPNAWQLVPGEVVARHRNMKQYLNKLASADGQRQKAEYHYYTLCSVCDRTMHRTMLEGCNHCRDAPRPADTEAARAAYEKMISRLHEQEEELNRRIATGDGARVTSLVAHRF